MKSVFSGCIALFSGNPHTRVLTPGVNSSVSTEEFQHLCTGADPQFRAMLMIGRYIGLTLEQSALLLRRDFQEGRRRLRIPTSGRFALIPVGPKLTATLRHLAMFRSPSEPLFSMYFSMNAVELNKTFTLLQSGSNLQCFGQWRPRLFSDLYFQLD